MSDSGDCNGYNVGPQMRINDLPKGEQVVTTVKREDIPKPPKKETTPLWVYILIAYLVMIFLWGVRDNTSGGLYPPEYNSPPYPERPYQPEPYYPPCPSPEVPVCPW